MDTEQELIWQMEKAKGWFGTLTHVDSHLHLHGIPWIHALVKRRCGELGIEHLRNCYEPLWDNPLALLHPWNALKLLLLAFFHARTKHQAEPCFGISEVFSMTANQCQHILERTFPKRREFIWHASQLDSLPPPQANRFIDEQQILLRDRERQELLLFLKSF